MLDKNHHEIVTNHLQRLEKDLREILMPSGHFMLMPSTFDKLLKMVHTYAMEMAFELNKELILCMNRPTVIECPKDHLILLDKNEIDPKL